MGRQDTFVWRYFTKEKKENCKYLIARCKFCGVDYLTNARRMRRHILKCPKSTQSAKAAIQKVIPLEEASISNRGSVGNTANISESSQNSTTQTESQVLDNLLARAFFSSGIPFQFIENDYFKKFISRLAPFYVLPTEKQLCTKLLEKEYQFIDKLAKNEIDKADSVTLIADSWTDTDGNPVVNVLASTPKYIFVKSIEIGRAHSGSYISEMLVNVIEEIGAEKVSSMITDKEDNVKLLLAWEKLKETFPHMEFFGCAAHGLNLLTQDILSLPFISNIVERSKKIIELFTSNLMVMRVLASKQKEIYSEAIRLLPVVETWWPSVNDSLKSLLDSKESLQSAAEHKRVASKISPLIQELLFDEENFWDNISNLSQMLEPICALINALQSDSTQLSCVVPGLKDIQVLLESHISFLDTDDQEAVLNVFKTRRKLLLCNIHWVATQLDPRLKTCLSEEEENLALDHILELTESYGLDRAKIVKELKDFKVKSGHWKHKQIWIAADKRDAKLWWKTLCGRMELSKLAIKVLDIPATAASCVKNLSTSLNIITKKKNHLGISKVDKLESVMFNLKLDVLDLNRSRNKSDETIPDTKDQEGEDSESGVDKLVALLEGSIESDTAYSDEDGEDSPETIIPEEQEVISVHHSYARKRHSNTNKKLKIEEDVSPDVEDVVIEIDSHLIEDLEKNKEKFELSFYSDSDGNEN